MIVNNIQLCPKQSLLMLLERELIGPLAIATMQGMANFHTCALVYTGNSLK